MQEGKEGEKRQGRERGLGKRRKVLEESEEGGGDQDQGTQFRDLLTRREKKREDAKKVAIAQKTC